MSTIKSENLASRASDRVVGDAVTVEAMFGLPTRDCLTNRLGAQKVLSVRTVPDECVEKGNVRLQEPITKFIEIVDFNEKNFDEDRTDGEYLVASLPGQYTKTSRPLHFDGVDVSGLRSVYPDWGGSPIFKAPVNEKSFYRSAGNFRAVGYASDDMGWISPAVGHLLALELQCLANSEKTIPMTKMRFRDFYYFWKDLVLMSAAHARGGMFDPKKLSSYVAGVVRGGCRICLNDIAPHYNEIAPDMIDGAKLHICSLAHRKDMTRLEYYDSVTPGCYIGFFDDCTVDAERFLNIKSVVINGVKTPVWIMVHQDQYDHPHCIIVPKTTVYVRSRMSALTSMGDSVPNYIEHNVIQLEVITRFINLVMRYDRFWTQAKKVGIKKSTLYLDLDKDMPLMSEETISEAFGRKGAWKKASPIATLFLKAYALVKGLRGVPERLFYVVSHNILTQGFSTKSYSSLNIGLIPLAAMCAAVIPRITSQIRVASLPYADIFSDAMFHPFEDKELKFLPYLSDFGVKVFYTAIAQYFDDHKPYHAIEFYLLSIYTKKGREFNMFEHNRAYVKDLNIERHLNLITNKVKYWPN